MGSIRSSKQSALIAIVSTLGVLTAFAANELREEFHQTYPLNKQG